MNNLRKIYPLIMIIIFSLVIFYYYKKNLDEFKNFKNINFFFFLKIIILSMIYLISEV